LALTADPATAAARRAALLLLAVMVMLLFGLRLANAAVAISVTVAPPPLPVYEQPVIPGVGYIWVPGYWSYGDQGYFWVPGTWVLPPDPDLLWTPGYWSFQDGAYLWNAGYWAPTVGFYGGIDYGYGYYGRGYEGGYWREHRFYYNREANNIGSVNVTNVYNRTVVNNVTNTVSYAGGPGGTRARPTAQEEGAARQARHAPTSEQMEHVSLAAQHSGLRASANAGHPEIAATGKPGAFSGPGTTHARGSSEAQRPPASEPPRRLAEAPQTPQRPAPAHPAPPTEHGAGRPTPERPAPAPERAQRAAPPQAPPERPAPPHEAPAPQRSEPRTEPRAEPRSEPRRDQREPSQPEAPHRTEERGN
jgi:hypothetical protein